MATKFSPSTMFTVLKSLSDKPGQTAAELGVSSAVANALRVDGVIAVASTRKHVNSETGKADRGRPSNEYKVARKGRDRMRSRAFREFVGEVPAKPEPVVAKA
jgi:predicted ArsR family transcriptional regulator